MKKRLLILGLNFFLVSINANASTQSLGGITWLESEPSGYHSWSDANSWCTNQGYRLPTMSELIAAWNAGGSKPSPTGFKKDTFYWASEAVGTDKHKACSMDYNCSTDDTLGTPDNGFGHPKCVVSTTSSTSSTASSSSVSSSSIGWGAETVTPVTYEAALNFCKILSQRLPTKSEAATEYNANKLSSFNANYFWTSEVVGGDGFHSNYVYTFGKTYETDTMWPTNDYGVYARCINAPSTSSSSSSLISSSSSSSQSASSSSTATLIITSSVIEELGSGWHLLGSSNSLNDFTIFKSAKLVWFYDNASGWKNVDPSQTTAGDVNVKNFQGFWIKK